MSSDNTVGAELARRARQDQGTSQQELADLARVSARTVRALESGAIGRPRTSTLIRVAAALGLSESDRDRLMTAWGVSRPRRVRAAEDLVSDPDRHARLLAEIRRGEQLSIASAHTAVSIDARRAIAWQDHRRVGVALAAGVDRYTMVLVADRPDVAADYRIDNLSGCTLGRARRLDDVTSTLQLRFDRTLGEGEAHYFRYRRHYLAAPEPQPAGTWDGRNCMLGMHRGAEVCVIEVRFRASDLPVRRVYLHRDQLGGVEQPVRELPVTASGLAQLALVQPAAGWHGIGWQW